MNTGLTSRDDWLGNLCRVLVDAWESFIGGVAQSMERFNHDLIAWAESYQRLSARTPAPAADKPSPALNANQKSMALLDEYLTPHQRETLKHWGYIDETGPSGAHYTIPASIDAFVHVVMPNGMELEMCVGPRTGEWLPLGDQLLAKLMWIRHNEPLLYEHGNFWGPGGRLVFSVPVLGRRLNP